MNEKESTTSENEVVRPEANRGAPKLPLGKTLGFAWRIFKREWWKLFGLTALPLVIWQLMKFVPLSLPYSIPHWLFYQMIRPQALTGLQTLLNLGLSLGFLILRAYFASLVVNTVASTASGKPRGFFRIPLRVVGWFILWQLIIDVGMVMDPAFRELMMVLIAKPLQHSILEIVVFPISQIMLLVLSVPFGLVAFALVWERKALPDAVRRNFSLISGSFWRILGARAAYAVPVEAAGYILTIILTFAFGLIFLRSSLGYVERELIIMRTNSIMGSFSTVVSASLAWCVWAAVYRGLNQEMQTDVSTAG